MVSQNQNNSYIVLESMFYWTVDCQALAKRSTTASYVHCVELQYESGCQVQLDCLLESCRLEGFGTWCPGASSTIHRDPELRNSKRSFAARPVHLHTCSNSAVNVQIHMPKVVHVVDFPVCVEVDDG